MASALEKLEIKVNKAELKRIPTTPVEFSEEQLEDIEKMLDKLEEDEDVQGVYTISNPADSLLDKGKFANFFKKFPDDKWLVTHDIFNSDLPVPVAQENVSGN